MVPINKTFTALNVPCSIACTYDSMTDCADDFRHTYLARSAWFPTQLPAVGHTQANVSLLQFAQLLCAYISFNRQRVQTMIMLCLCSACVCFAPFPKLLANTLWCHVLPLTADRVSDCMVVKYGLFGNCLSL